MRRISGCLRACFLFFLWAAAANVLPAQTFTTLHSFAGTDGSDPQAGLLQATDGKLYGTASGGGTSSGCGDGCGTAFAITTAGALFTLHSFHAMDGAFPVAGMVQGADGSFYGTTVNGGHGYGTIFKIMPSGVLTTLYSFCPHVPCTDGSRPYAGLVQGADGALYGAASSGGMGGSGTVFKITLSGVLTALHKFNGLDGSSPTGGLIQGSDGAFYGTTQLGGNNESGRGTVFKITRGGVLTTLHDFNNTDGSSPYAGLVQGDDGNFYGTTSGGGLDVAGCGSGCGTVFKITPDGKLTTLHEFDLTDGRDIEAALIQATDGNFYGTTLVGGSSDDGTIYRIMPGGTLTTLYNFCLESGCLDGEEPNALVQDTDGRFYGTAVQGGTDDDGTVFSLSVGLGPFVETQPTSRNVGAGVKILGTNLTGATSVTFNGTPAAFTVQRKTLIRTTVPAGATTGTVQVVTPKGILSSNVLFQVRP